MRRITIGLLGWFVIILWLFVIYAFSGLDHVLYESIGLTIFGSNNYNESYGFFVSTYAAIPTIIAAIPTTIVYFALKKELGPISNT